MDLDLETAIASQIVESTGRLLIHTANLCIRYIGRAELTMDQVLLELAHRADGGDRTAARYLADHRDRASAYTTAKTDLDDLVENGSVALTHR